MPTGVYPRKLVSIRPVVYCPDGTAWIFLTRGKVAVVDQVDADLGETQTWQARQPPRSGFYAVAKSLDMIHRPKSVDYLHRFIGARIGIDLAERFVDHINGDTLDCRRSNLRAATNAQNQFNKGRYKNNTSGHKGVCWHQTRGKWTAKITANKQTKRLGYFSELAEAVAAYDAAAVILHGEFARRKGEK